MSIHSESANRAFKTVSDLGIRTSNSINLPATEQRPERGQSLWMHAAVPSFGKYRVISWPINSTGIVGMAFVEMPQWILAVMRIWPQGIESIKAEGKEDPIYEK